MNKKTCVKKYYYNRGRDARTGKFISVKVAKENPKTTIVEKVVK